MANSKKNRKILNKSELKRIESIKKQIQSSKRQRQDYEDSINKLPEYSSIMRTLRKCLRNFRKDHGFTALVMPFEFGLYLNANLMQTLRKCLSKYTKANGLESWMLPLMQTIELGLFVDKNVEQTRQNLRRAFKNSPRKKILYPGSIAITMQVYVNSHIQSFFEFSLRYSFFKQKELSLKQAQTLFINASKVAIGLRIENKKIHEKFQNYQNFMDGQVYEFDLLNLPSGKGGKPLGYRADKTKKRERLKKQGFTVREITAMEFPGCSPKEKRELIKIEKMREKDEFTKNKETVKKSLQRSRKKMKDK